MKKISPIRWLIIILAALFFTATVLAFSGYADFLAIILHSQFGPALLKKLSLFSVAALCVIIGIILFTFLCGRFYCSVLCPLGILQEIILWLTRSKGKIPANLSKLRYAIAGLVFGLFAFGITSGFFLLSPYSNFGRIVASISVASILALVILVILVAWKKRIYCTAICPVGTLLGVFAKYGIFRLHLTDDCVKCGLCVKKCPAGCIDLKTGIIDNERCVRCMRCVAVCNRKTIKLSLFTKTVRVNRSRREFIINGSVLLAGLIAGIALAKTGVVKLAEFAQSFKILPPGAKNSQRFTEKCTACQLCTANCPAKIITPAPNGIGPVSLDFTNGFCQYDCHRCSQICPTGAILPITLAEKQKTKIAEAKFIGKFCLVFEAMIAHQETHCGICAFNCPTGAITLRENGTPKLDKKMCIGCGACQFVCPATEKAMVVEHIDEQKLLEIN